MKNSSRFRIHHTGSRAFFSKLLRSLAMVSIVVVAVAAPVAPASAASSNQSTWHRGGIAKMRVAHAVTTLGPVSIPVSQNQIGWLALSNIGAVEPFNIRTGQLLNSPIYLPTGLVPVSLAYWQPNPLASASATEDPLLLVVSNNASTNADSLTFIDAARKTVLKTISLGGTFATSVATNVINDYAVVTDTNAAGTASRLRVIDLGGKTAIQTLTPFTGNPNVLSQAVFDPSGDNVYVAAPTLHKILIYQNQYTASPLVQPAGSTYTGSSSFNPESLVVGASGSLYVATSNSALKKLYRFNGTYPNGSTVTPLVTLPAVANDLVVNRAETRAFVSLAGASNNLASVDLTTNSLTTSTSTASSNALALTDDSGTLLVGDGTSGATDFLTMATGSSGQRIAGTADGTVVSIATPVSTAIHYNTYTVQTNYVTVVDSSTSGVVDTIASGGGTIACVLPSPDGKFVYLVSQAASGSTTPVITLNETAQFGTGLSPTTHTFSVTVPSSMLTPVITSAVLSPSGDTIVMTDSANSAVLSIDVSTSLSSTYGQVTNIAALNGSTAMTPISVTMTPDGSFLYVSSVATSGTLRGITSLVRSTTSATYGTPVFQDASSLHDTPPSGSAVTLVKPTQLVASPTGQGLFVLDANATQPLLFQLAITSSGQLASDPGPAFFAGNNPVALSISPTAAVAYLSDGTTWNTQGLNIADPLNPFILFSATASSAPTSNCVTPDGQYVGVGTTGYGWTPPVLQIYLASDATPSYTLLTGSVNAVAVSPTSSSLTLTSSLNYDGQIGWSELLNGGTNPAIRAASSLVAFHSDGTPSDAPGVRAGTSTALRSYAFSLNSLSIPTLGLPLDLSASYDSARIMNGLDTAANQPDLAMGWRLSLGAKATQNPNSGLFACQIQVTQADGSIVKFNPATSGTTCPSASYQALPWAQSELTSYATCPVAISGACWKVTYLLSGESDYFDATASSHRMLARSDRFGNLQSFVYSSGRLASVTASTRTLTFSYPSAGSASCPNSVGSLSVSSCVVVTDPIGRTVTYVLTGNATSGYDLSAVTLARGSSLATYRFSYLNHYLVSWWTPQNVANGAASNEATSVTYASTTPGTIAWVAKVEAPYVFNEGVSGTDSFRATTTFTYVDQDLFSGNGTVLVSDPNTNYNATHTSALPGANVTLDRYVSFTLAAQIQGYGPSESPLVNDTAISATSATTLRDPFTLMSVETIGARAGTGSGSLYSFDISLFSYDALGNVLAMWTPGVSAGTWNENDFAYNQTNQVISATDPLGHVTTATYDSLGRVIATTTPATNSWTAPAITSNYYLASGLLCASRDANEVAQYGALTSCTATHATLYSYNAAGDLVLSTDPLGHVNQSAYDLNGNLCATLTANAYANGQTLTSCPSTATPNVTATLARNVYGSPTISSTPSNAPGGLTFAYYNANNDVVASVGILGNPTLCDPLTVFTCPFTSYSTYNALGAVTTSVAPSAFSGVSGPSSQSFLDPSGHSVASVDAGGVKNVSIPTSLGTTQSSALASSLSASCSLNSLSSICPNASYSRSDAAGNPTSSLSATSSGTGVLLSTTTYDPMGNVARSTDPTGALTTSTYDANGQTLQSTSTKGSLTTGSTSAYNPNGSLCWSTPLVIAGTPDCANPPLGALNQTTLNYYDQDGRLVATTNPGTVTYSPATPSACNPLTTSTCDSVTYYSYDEAGHRTQTITPSGPSGTRALTSNYFDASGNLVATVTPIGAGTGCNPLTTSTCLGTSYSSYDADNRLLTVSYTDGTPSVSYSYNADGSKATQSDGTGTSTFSYDSAGRLVGTTNGAGATTTWGYNTLGQLICQSYDNPAANTCRGSGAGTSSPPPGLLTFSYDALGRASSLITWTGVTLTTAYDCAGSKAWVSTGTASVLSCDESHLATPAVPTSSSAITTTYSQNATGQFTNQATTKNAGATNLLSFSFSYDDLGRLTGSTPTLNSLTKSTDNYGYDPTSRVTSGPITGTSGNPNYSYSPTGAITQATTHFATAAYAPNGQLCWTSATSTSSPSCSTVPTGATTFNYDQNGNRTSSTSPLSSTSLSWQSTSGRLVCVNTAGTSCSTTSPSATTTLYSYDADGHRATSSNNGVTNSFIWDTGASQLLADSTHDYVYLQGSVSPDLQINLTTGTVDLLIQDQNANTRGVVQVVGTNSTFDGTIVNYTDYDAYGNAITQSGGSVNPGGMANGGVTTDISTSFAFGAGYWDSSNLTYLVHRYLDNETGQFISVDPLVDQTREAYVYAGDGPIEGNDPSGLFFESRLQRDYGIPGPLPWTTVPVAIGAAASIRTIIRLLAAMLTAAQLKQIKETLRNREKIKIPILFGQRRISPNFNFEPGHRKIFITTKYAGFPIKVFPGFFQGKLCAIAINNRTLANASLNNVQSPAVEWAKPDAAELARLNEGPTAFSKGTLPSRTIPVTSKKDDGVLLANYGNSGYVTSRSYAWIGN